MKKNGTILIIGGTSGIAQSFACEALKSRYSIILAARNLSKLEIIVKDLEIRSNTKEIPTIYFDNLKMTEHKEFFDSVLKICPDLAGVLIASGVMYDQTQCFDNFDLSKEMIDTNFTSLISIINIFTKYFLAKNCGFISVISSVAGDRGRQNNYLYGSTKAALSSYLQGLRAKLSKSNILIQTIKPGPVDTQMSKGLPNLPFLISPQKASKLILKAIESTKDVVYVPKIWKYIMFMICMIPEFIFKRLKI